VNDPLSKPLTTEVRDIRRFQHLMRHGQYEHLLKQSLGLKEREAISLVGAGGKTSLMFLLAKTLTASGHRVITTTTTKIFEPTADQTPFLSLGETQEAVLANVNRYQHVTVVSHWGPEGKLQGISPEQVDTLWKSGKIDYLIVEADGAARRPLKAPESYEPVIPSCTGVVIGLLGADGFDTLLDEETVFRASIFSRLTGLPLGARVSYEAIVKAFTHKDGIIKGAPRSARVVPFVNKVDLDQGLTKGREFARVILDSRDPRIDRVVLGQLESDPPVVEVIFPQ